MKIFDILSKKYGNVRVPDLASECNIGRDYAYKVIQILAKAGFVYSSRGQQGGVQLAFQLKDLTLGEFIYRSGIQATVNEQFPQLSLTDTIEDIIRKRK